MAWGGDEGDGGTPVILTREALVELALEVTRMSPERWDAMTKATSDDAAMNLIMKQEWESEPRDSEAAIRDYYRKSDIWFVNTFNHGVGGLLEMSRGIAGNLSPWQKEFVSRLSSPGRILDYGGGFLSDSWPLVMRGFEVSIAEVKGPVTEYLRAYGKLVDVPGLIDVVEVDSSEPILGLYSGALCFETLEHLLDPISLAKHIEQHLRYASPLAFSVSFGAPSHAPYHVASNAPLAQDGVWLEKLKEIGFDHCWSDPGGHHMQIWRRT